MELSEQLLKELQKLQELYKVNFDLVSQKVEAQGEKLTTTLENLEQTTAEQQQLNELLKEIIAEKDVQIQRLLKAVAALTVVTDQLTTRFNQQQ